MSTRDLTSYVRALVSNWWFRLSALPAFFAKPFALRLASIGAQFRGWAALGSRKPVAGCFPSPPLHGLICVALWLLPATALIVTHGTAYPYIFGKAVFVRTIIEIILPVYVALILLSGRFVPSRNSL